MNKIFVNRTFAGCSALLSAAMLLAAGCEPTNLSSTAAQPDRWTVATPLDSAESISRAAEQLGGQESPVPVTLVGRVDAGEFDAFDPDQATFMLSELPDPNHAADDPDHAENCPFCKRRAAQAPKAIVRLLNDQNEVIASDARKLVSVATGDRVAVQGPARFDPDVNAVTIDAQQMHVIP